MLLRKAPMVVVGALCAQPVVASAADDEAFRVRALIELVVRPGSMKPPGIAVAADASLFPRRRWYHPPTPSLGGSARVELFLDREVRFGLEPTVGIAGGDLQNYCGLAWGLFQGPAVHAELRPGLIHSLRTGTHVWVGGSVEGTYLPLIGRVRGGATVSLRRHKNPSKFEKLYFREVFANVSGGLGLAHVPACRDWAVGRPLWEEAEMVLPDITEAGVLVGPAMRWARQAQEEHAAVAAFLRLAEELAMVGAPAHLVQAARSAARDEVVHARLCLERAATLSGSTVRLGEVRAAVRHSLDRMSLLAVLRDESLRDGWYNEGLAAMDAVNQANAADNHEDWAIQSRIAVEEARHALFGWQVAEWCQQVLTAAA